jgi:hypothetical protein
MLINLILSVKLAVTLEDRKHPQFRGRNRLRQNRSKARLSVFVTPSLSHNTVFHQRKKDVTCK